jgi:hypothetical protein
LDLTKPEMHQQFFASFLTSIYILLTSAQKFSTLGMVCMAKEGLRDFNSLSTGKRTHLKKNFQLAKSIK